MNKIISKIFPTIFKQIQRLWLIVFRKHLKKVNLYLNTTKKNNKDNNLQMILMIKKKIKQLLNKYLNSSITK